MRVTVNGVLSGGFKGVVLAAASGLWLACRPGDAAPDRQLSLSTSSGSVSGSTSAAPAAEPGSFAPIARAVTPAVVSIQTVLPPDTTGEDDQGGGIPPGLLPPGMVPPGFRRGPGGRVVRVVPAGRAIRAAHRLARRWALGSS
jgi:hypothetical protein